MKPTTTGTYKLIILAGEIQIIHKLAYLKAQGGNMRFFVLYNIALLATLITFSVPALAESQKNKQDKIHKQISREKSKLVTARKTSEKLHKDVLNSEQKLNESSRQLHDTENKINKLATKLNKSNALKQKLLQQTDQEKNAIAQQMQALYTSGKQSHLRLLLKQDDPSDISRTVKYFEYMNEHRLKRIKKIKVRLEKIKTVQTQINKDTADLTKLQKQQGTTKKELKLAVKQRERSYKKQRKTLITQEQKFKKLKREESRLQGVISRLAAKQALAEKKREREKAKRKKEKIKLAKAENSKKAIAKKATSIKITKPRYVPNKAFSSLQGKLAWPVRGRITKHYGNAKNSKQNWKGVIISAPGGSKVHSVARGTVEFSGRLNGYGYLIIIRHDKNYRSLYAYNRSVYKKQGQIVKAGEVIAAVGNSGGRSQNGLYFEIRKGTVHRNPAKWCH